MRQWTQTGTRTEYFGSLSLAYGELMYRRSMMLATSIWLNRRCGAQTCYASASRLVGYYKPTMEKSKECHW
ncbi:hypothetical protein AGR4C_Lc90216 [Agrobacterium tumefaciens str. Kerr 14]|uniref:Uncharacterized protein n=1 Tax=Agrobacterium tumefaciens str. Kerr 14 TaxID=1183424 RepID=A0A1S7S8W3_AGRTU|nr:hypothetical protein AGR4C_Lc90216 [Agrobacterium tumefaciens str. Kerr 14]